MSRDIPRGSTRHSPGTLGTCLPGAPDTIRTCDRCLSGPAPAKLALAGPFAGHPSAHFAGMIGDLNDWNLFDPSHPIPDMLALPSCQLIGQHDRPMGYPVRRT